MSTIGALASNLRVKIEESIKRLRKLPLDLLFARAFDQMHSHSRGLAILQMDFPLFEAFQLVDWKQTDSVNQCQLCHQMNISSSCVIWSTVGRRPFARLVTAARTPASTALASRTGLLTAALTLSPA